MKDIIMGKIICSSGEGVVASRLKYAALKGKMATDFSLKLFLHSSIQI